MGSPSRVLILDENLPVPFDRRVWMEACALRDAGYQVVVICPVGKTSLSRFELREGVEIHRHPLGNEAARAHEYPREYAQALWHEFVLAAGLRARPFDVVHLCNPPDVLFLVGGWLKARDGTAVIFDQHDLAPELYEAKYGRRGTIYRGLLVAERLTYAAADVVIATNETYREVALSRGGKRSEDVFVVRNGPDLSRFVRSSRDAASSIPAGRQLVGYVGTMAEQEGIDYLLRSVSIVVHDLQRDDVSFVVVGGGPALDSLRSLCSEMRLDDHVRFPGRVSDDELIATLSACDVCVNPDPKTPFNDASTMTKIMDYMALGKPIVQFDLKEGRRSAGDASLMLDRMTRPTSRV